MALTAQQIQYLKTADQRFTAHVGVFPAYTPTVTAPTPGLLAPTPIVRCSPRYSLVNNGGSITLLGTNSYVRGGVGVTPTFALQGGSAGSVTDHADGTATYTAPASGSGIATIEITATNTNGSKTGYAFVQYPKTLYDDTVAEIASVSAGVDQHGYKMLLRAKGDVSAFGLGKFVVLHVEDTWAGTTSTFGGYQYHEGVMAGYITEMEQFEDWSGETWLGCEIQSPWWLLGRIPVGETHWGYTVGGGRNYITDFRPVDALWHFLNELTDFTAYHDVIMWYDQNSIDDFIVDESDLATIVEDVMARTLSITYCDRYGSLFCVPDPDVRGDEFWGTPAPTYTGSEALTPDLVMDYNITHNAYRVKKLTLSAFDRSKRGIFAISENPTSLGSKEHVRGLLCDQAPTLASWSVQKRAQMNRPWQIDVGAPLNHTMDLCNFADVDFTTPSQTNGKTASGRTWLSNLTYRPNIYDGGWVTRWTLLNQTEGQGEAETGSVSAWGDSGTTDVIDNPYTGDWPTSGWTSTASGTLGTWCYLFDFINDGGGEFTALMSGNEGGWYNVGWYALSPMSLTVNGWEGGTINQVASVDRTGEGGYVRRYFAPRSVTGLTLWFSATGQQATRTNQISMILYTSAWHEVVLNEVNYQGTGVIEWSGNATAGGLSIGAAYDIDPSLCAVHFKSARIAGIGTNPIDANNCTG